MKVDEYIHGVIIFFAESTNIDYEKTKQNSALCERGIVIALKVKFFVSVGFLKDS